MSYWHEPCKKKPCTEWKTKNVRTFFPQFDHLLVLLLFFWYFYFFLKNFFSNIRAAHFTIISHYVILHVGHLNFLAPHYEWPGVTRWIEVLWKFKQQSCLQVKNYINHDGWDPAFNQPPFSHTLDLFRTPEWWRPLKINAQRSGMKPANTVGQSGLVTCHCFQLREVAMET